MKKETLEKLKEFNISDCQECLLGEKYVNFEEYLNHTVCGEGMVEKTTISCFGRKMRLKN